ncbi:hypothetical protein I6A60_24420 [Frankia sp. AgB1.9]|uniref:hypothetical protein n=1 Tax=unclassified Frankia TaxID=2632575 RepID=UPI001EE3B9E3|nr:MULTISPECIES: hypothetical protein [unclassified Frankia]MBL7494474.1 hypothetical protein [Frankia sp. AgW1.1]MBL7550986.1 hypothetical protein [Frankia sp. AgB1.9]
MTNQQRPAVDVVAIAGQYVLVGRRAAGRTITAHVADTTITLEVGDGEPPRTVVRTTTQPVTSIKAHQPPKADTVS